MLYIIDTNILIRTLVRSDEKASMECGRVLEMVKNGKIDAVLPGITLAEIAWVMGSIYKSDLMEQLKALRSIKATKGLKIEDKYDHAEAIDLYAMGKAKYIDCVIATMTKSLDATIISYDKEFGKLPVKWVTPTELLKSLPKKA